MDNQPCLDTVTVLRAHFLSMGNLPELMTVAEVAEALRISDETVHRWAREGRLPAIWLPGGPVERSGLKRFRRADVEAILRGDSAEVAS